MKQQTFIIDSIGGKAERGWEGDVAPCRKASHYKFPPAITQDAGFCAEHSAKAGGIGYQEEVAPTLRAGVTTALMYATYDARCNGDGMTASTLTGDHENRITDYTAVVCEMEPVYCLQGNGIDRSDTARCNGAGWRENVSYTLNTIDRPAVAYAIGNGQLNQMSMAEQSNTLDCMHDQQAILVFDKEVYNSGINANGGHYITEDGPAPAIRTEHPPGVCARHIVRRLTPTECARLQGFPDRWGHPEHKDRFTDEEMAFWQGVRDVYAEINGKQVKVYTAKQMIKWYNGLHTDSAEYRMWGNGITLQCALFVMDGIAEIGGKDRG